MEKSLLNREPTLKVHCISVIIHMSYSLNSLKGGSIGQYIGITIGEIKGDTRSLDSGSYNLRGKGQGKADVSTLDSSTTSYRQRRLCRSYPPKLARNPVKGSLKVMVLKRVS